MADAAFVEVEDTVSTELLEKQLSEAEEKLAELQSTATEKWAGIGRVTHQSDVLQGQILAALPDHLSGSLQQLEFFRQQVTKLKNDLMSLEPTIQSAGTKVQELMKQIKDLTPED